MATDDASLIVEVRDITEYNAEIISDEQFQRLVSLAQREIAAKVGIPDLDFYNDLDAERALFWLTCLFAKIRAGEVDGVEMQIGDIRNKPLRVDGEEDRSMAVVWRAEFNDYFNQLLTQNGGSFGSRRISRGDSRTYGE